MDEYTGLFGYIKNATITGISIIDIDISIPSNIKTIRTGAFTNCHNLQSIEVDLTNQSLKQFIAYAGINANQQAGGNVIFKVYVDDQLIGQSEQVNNQNAKLFEIVSVIFLK